MRPLAGAAGAAARFLYDFLVGDDSVAAAVLLAALAATGLLVRTGANPWWLVPAVAVLMTALSLYRHRTAR